MKHARFLTALVMAAVLFPTSWGVKASGTAGISDAQRKELLAVREQVWRAWFDNDQAKLKQLVPADTLAIDAGEADWHDQNDALTGSAKFGEQRGKLLTLEFPRTEIQLFGNVAILYSQYHTVTEVDGKQQDQQGRSTEIFVKRSGKWVNPGWHVDSGK